MDAFGKFVVGGNLTVGLVVFTIRPLSCSLLSLQRYRERVAEVSVLMPRFLDGMPCKQMSIDGDLRAGASMQTMPGTLRQYVQQESRFLGAMQCG